MNFLLFVMGIAVLGLSGSLLYFGWPKEGQVRPVIANDTLGELYTFAVILSLAIGIALVLNAVLSG
jgi:hypothetical protein